MSPFRLRIALGSLCAAMLLMQCASAQYPVKPIHVIVPYPAGIGFDVLVRAMAPEMSQSLGQPVIIDNRPGVSTIAGAEACAKSPGDGYTTCVVSRDTLSFNPYLHRKLPYDPAKDFDLVTPLVFQTSVLTVNSSMPVRTVQELISLARTKPGTLNYGSMGAGGVTHMFMELLKKRNGVEIVHVPYKGPAPLVQGLVSGEVQITYFSLASQIGYIKAGRLRALAVSGDKRAPMLPDVPAVAELGVTGLDDRVWYALMLPAGSPKEAASRLAAEVSRIYFNPTFRSERLDAQGWEPVNMSPGQFAAFLVADRKVGAEMVKLSGAHLD